MKKKMSLFTTVLSALSVMVLLSACGSQVSTENTTPESTEQTQPTDTTTDTSSSSDELNIMYEDEYIPYSYTENGGAKGLSIDIISEVAKISGLKVKFETAPWKRIQEMVENGEADAFCAPYKTAEREAKYSFPTQYLCTEDNVFIVKKDSTITFNGDLSELKNYTIGSLTGYPTLKEEEANKTAKVDRSENNEQAIEKLLNNRGVDLVVQNKLVLATSLKKTGNMDKVKFLDKPYKSELSYLAFTKKKDMTKVMEKFDKAISEMRTNGSYDKLVEKYTK